MIVVRNIYVPAMCLAGILVGGFVRANPAFATAAIPPYVWLLALSLVFDLATMALAGRVAIVPMTMNARAFGFISGVVLYLLIVHAFPAGAPAQGA